MVQLITLEIPRQVNEDGNTIPGGSFVWVRGTEGEHSFEGNWETLGSYLGLPPGVVVHINLQQDLTKIAQARGLDDGHGFKRTILVPKKESVKREPKDPNAKSSRKPSAGLMGGFNPFAKTI